MIQRKSALGLKPFVIRVKDGFLVGLSMPPEKGSPCTDCVHQWLKLRDVWFEPAEVTDLNIRRDVISTLLAENSPHTLFEVSNLGNVTRLDSLVFPHPECACAKGNYIAPTQWNSETNFAFSPIYQLKCIRYGTPSGNLWLTCATGNGTGARPLTAYGVARDREKARFMAVENWMKKSAMETLSKRLKQGDRVSAEGFQNGDLHALDLKSLGGEGLGIGATKEQAMIDSLMDIAKRRTLKKYANQAKNPMLVVGANQWIRNQVPFFMIQNYDIHLLFYPNSTPAWVVGVVAMSRKHTDEPPTFVFASHWDINEALKQSLFRLLEHCRPDEWRVEEGQLTKGTDFGLPSKHATKLCMWWTHWIYRCSKISLKDLTNLEPYSTDISSWREYFGDGLETLSVVPLNNTQLPKSLRQIVKINLPPEPKSNVTNIKGIGTWNSFDESVY